MKLREVGSVVWDIVAACDGNGNFPALEFLTNAEAKDAAAQILKRMTGFYAERGPDQGPKSTRLRNGIWEWKQGKLRVLWFHDRERQIAIATHGFVK